MKLVIGCQDYENYAWTEDGLDTANPYWKAKGGPELMLEEVERFVDITDSSAVEAFVNSLSENIEESSGSFIRSVIGWELKPDDYLSWFEKSQLDYDGEIVMFEPRINERGEILRV